MRSQEFGINRRATSLAAARFQLLPHKGKADVLFNQPQQMSLRNLIFQTEVIEQRFGAVVLPHHDQQSSGDENPTEHGFSSLSSNMLPPNLIPLIEVTFSTPTSFIMHKYGPKKRALFSPDSNRTSLLYNHGELRDFFQIRKFLTSEPPVAETLPVQHVSVHMVLAIKIGQVDA